MLWFRFDEVRFTLRFRNGAIDFTFANLGGPESWAWVAQKRDSHRLPSVLARSGNMLGLRAVLRHHGFPVTADSEAERAMRAAEKAGYAKELPEDERWRGELIAARAKAERKP
jgi:hypothetical protein